MKRVVAIVQARTGSTRLPGKVLLDLGGRSVLGNVLVRLGRTARVDEIVCATTTLDEDERIVAEAQRFGVRSFRGSPDDVLMRYAGAAAFAGADVVVRITSDCPFVDPLLVDRMVTRFVADDRLDYLSNGIVRSFPRGLDVEVFSREALDSAGREATAGFEREHVTPYVYGHPESFAIANEASDGPDLSALRLTLDTPDDYAMLRSLCAALDGDPTDATTASILAAIATGGLARINAGVVQKKLGE